ncbi:PREDICTED: golgin subfamily A member 6-like protein 22, partial [Vollenhovia emeryi]|uniref:golgin subfamily A member 6-like protein 22 n=1 Tax=Vollenhovia emeryi TaxID=411798 RepID=UPI0005F41A04
MRSMMERLERYLDRKGLTLNSGKTKIMRFRAEGGRRKEIDWRWKGERIEEVKEFGYLGYKLQRNGGQEAQVRERVRRAATAMRQVWGIGKRKFGKDWRRRLWLFDRLVYPVLEYGAEIWGWKEREKVEALHEKYLRWTLGVEGRTPGYIVREELQREKLRGRLGKRARGFEERLKEGKGSDLARKCWEERKERERKGKGESKWEKERREFLKKRGIEEESEEGSEEGRDWRREIEEWEGEEQRKE